MKRQPFWQCEYGHIGQIPGRGVDTEDQLGGLLVRVEQKHAELQPACPATLMRLAPKPEMLDKDAVAIQWQIDRIRAHMSYAERKDSRIILPS